MSESTDKPKLVNRRDNRKSTFRMGRTIGEKREKLETANERAAARKKDKKKQTMRIIITIAGFIILLVALVLLLLSFTSSGGEPQTEELDISYSPTIEIIDEDSPSEAHITSRMRLFIGQVEKELRDLGYSPIKAVVPTGAVREIDFYLENHPGYIKTIIDRGAAVTVEDIDRMIRYLEGIGVTDYSYIDVRIDKKAYWK